MATYHPQLATVQSDIRVLKWQIGALIAAQVLIGVPALTLLLRMAAKLGALAF